MTEPKKRPSADKTRKTLLKAAQTLFAKHGFAGTSISMIAKRAKINQSLIYHHYENKEALWIAVKKHILDETFPDGEIEALNEINDAKTFIRQFMQTRFEFYQKNPRALRLMSWQTLEDKNDALNILNDKNFGLNLKTKIASFQADQQLRQDISPEVICMLLQRSTNQLFSYAHFHDKQDNLQQYLQETIKVILDSVLI